MKRTISSLALLALVLTSAPLAHAEIYRMATLAPRNSSWMKVLRRIAKKIRTATGKAVSIRFYPDGSMGDEPLIVEKMGLGQLQGAAVTNVGLSKIQPAMLVQQLPFLFRNYKELDCLREKMNDKFSAMMEEKGYVVLGYGDVGFAYLFLNKEAKSPEDLKDVKMWSWTDDPVGRHLVDVAGLRGVPLGLPDVLSSLQTGLIDAFYAAPYAAVALQWFTKAKYMVGMKLALAVGAVIMTKRAWDTISEPHKKIVKEIAAEGTKRLNSVIRRDNRNAIKALENQGVQILKVTKADAAPWRAHAKKVREHFVGKLYSQELLDEVRSTLKACRSGG